MHPDSYISTGEAATLCCLSTSTLRRYANAGHLISEVLPSGRRRIRVRDLVRFMLAHQLAVPAALDVGAC